MIDVFDPTIQSDCPLCEASGLINDRAADWQSGNELSGLNGRTVRLRVDLRDADLYGIQLVHLQL